MILRERFCAALRAQRTDIFAAAIVVAMAVSSFALDVVCNAADLSADLVSPVSAAKQAPPPNSVLVFGGALSTTDMHDTALFNLDTGPGSGQHYDNYIFGAAYDRDLVGLGYGFYLGVEVGIADRFGKYQECCNVVIKSNGVVQSGELWGGVQLRNEGFLLFDQVRIGGALTFGLSGATASIGEEREREIEDPGTASLLYYLGAELDFSIPSVPNLEFVLELHHRSGGARVRFMPTLGNMGEGYNANVAGIRYRF